MATDTERMDEEQDEDDWDPEPAQLREGETTDVSSHAARNIEQLRRAADEGTLSEEQVEESIQSIREKDQDDGENQG